MPRFPFIPREEKFYDLFEESARNLAKAAKLLTELLEKWDNIATRVTEITEIEHEGDAITHRIMSQLHRTFFTPLDREDIALLAHAMDDVLDFIQAAADAILIYRIASPTQRAKELAAILEEATGALELSIPMLRHHGKLQRTLSCCVELNRLENEADQVFRSALSELFDDSRDVAEVIKWREIYEHMESATDRCEDVANVLEGVALKYA